MIKVITAGLLALFPFFIYGQERMEDELLKENLQLIELSLNNS